MLITATTASATGTDPINLTGMWRNPNNHSPNAIIISADKHGKLTAMGTYRDIYGQQVVWSAKGVEHNKRVTFEFAHNWQFIRYGKGKIVYNIKDHGDKLDGKVIYDSSALKPDSSVWLRVKS